ncbi:serine kinase [candidate division WOR-3 bacterium]|nr:serine kinase [candidate division WOR-3 bacterium]
MKLGEVVARLGLELVGQTGRLDREVTGGYASDLLSDVMANAREGNVWVTLQIHQNVVAVATLKELAGIIIVNGRKPEPEVLAKAEQEGVPVMLTGMPAFEVAGRLYETGIRGNAK